MQFLVALVPPVVATRGEQADPILQLIEQNSYKKTCRAKITSVIVHQKYGFIVTEYDLVDHLQSLVLMARRICRRDRVWAPSISL
jgi:hypothetical protein